MRLSDLLTVERVACNIEAASKKRALEQLSALIAGGEDSLTPTEMFDSLISRERLGSTGLGKGVAIPHGRIKNVEKTVGAFIKLDQGIDFDALDNQPVDLLFALLVPEHATDEHLELLARLAEMFSDEELRRRLREADTPDTLYELLSAWQTNP